MDLSQNDKYNMVYFQITCLFLISLDSFHRVKLNYLSTSFKSY